MHKKIRTRSSERGNALIYVLIAIGLFGALSFTLSNTSSDSNTSELDDAKVEFYATQLISYASQAKSVIDQMSITGTSIDELDFTLPGEAGFDTAPHIHKVFHPQGGGLTLAQIPEEVQRQVSSSYKSAWYLGRFNNVEWTKTTGTDVILSAYQLQGNVCETINLKITGSATVPILTSGYMRHPLVDSTTDTDLTSTLCPDCEGIFALCVASHTNTEAKTFYSIIADR